MKILDVKANNKKKSILIRTKQSQMEIPYWRLSTKPSSTNKIIKIYIDKDLANEAITYELADGSQDSVPLDAFLDYNRDPDYLRIVTLHKMTAEVLRQLERKSFTKQELCRKLGTSLSQLYRLLDPADTKKTVDSMLRLLSVMGCDVSWKISKAA